MAGPKVADRVKETSTTTGTGTLDLAGTSTGYRTFVAGIATGNTCFYCIAHQTADEWEVGVGTVTDASPDTLSRTTILASSNAGAAVNFSAGTKDVFVTDPAALAGINGLTAETATADGDEVAIWDLSAGGLKKMTRANLVPINQQVITSSEDWEKPAFGNVAFIQVWGAGGSGGKNSNNTGGGAGGGGYKERFMLLSDLASTETVTIGAGGVAKAVNGNGNAGGNTTFGTHVTAYGGGGGGNGGLGVNAGGGGGGGTLSAGGSAAGSTAGAAGGGGGGFGGGAGASGAAGTGGSTTWGGSGGGSGSGGAGGTTLWGGGGGGSSTGGAAGASEYGGDGSAGVSGANNSANGSQPGGGSGGVVSGTSGTGGAGKCVVTVW